MRSNSRARPRAGRLTIWLLACATVLLPAALMAQTTDDARVLPSGVLRLEVGGTVLNLTERRFANAVERIDAPFNAPLNASLFPPVRLLADEFGAFFSETGEPADPNLLDGLSFGTLGVDARGERRAMPLGMELGLPGGFSLGVRGGVVRRQTILRSATLTNGTAGLNPDADGNRAVLASVDERYAALGGSPVLPVAGTPQADALQGRVRALTGDEELSLPGTAASIEDLNAVLGTELGLPGLQTAPEVWAPADTELHIRVQLPGSAPGLRSPVEGELTWRGVVGGGLTLPTGARTEPEPLFDFVPRDGRRGAWVEGVGDLYLTSRLWIGGGLRHTVFAADAGTRLVAPDDEPFTPITERPALARTPGVRTRASIEPRVQFSPALSLGAAYRFTRVGPDDLQPLTNGTQPENGLPAGNPGGSLHQVTVSLRYSALLAGAAPDTWPIEASLSYRGVVRSPPGMPAGPTLEVGARIHQRLWSQN